ncbi:hypothetical protein IKJ53_01350, partial [bacterium]|nr:hypothetical protein [bacterium]
SGIISANIPDVDTSQFVQKSGDTMTGVLNFKNTSSDKIRMTQGDYTAILHQNGESLYFLLTNQGDQDGSYNDLRPFSIVLSDGRLRGNHTLSMPSNYWVNLTLGASNSNYTAPANGYFIVAGNAGTSGGYVDMRNSSAGGLGILSTSSNANHGLRSFVPAKKGDVVNIGYSSSFGSSSKYLTFVYAEGST